MMKRAKGATLAEIQKLTGWQKHTVRGFITLLGGKAGLKIISVRSGAGRAQLSDLGSVACFEEPQLIHSRPTKIFFGAAQS